MKDENLNKVLENLPVYQAPSAIWESIASDLDLKKDLENLPVYKAPVEVWHNIAPFLPQEGMRVQYVNLQKKMPRRVAAVALVVITLTLALWKYTPEPTPIAVTIPQPAPFSAPRIVAIRPLPVVEKKKKAVRKPVVTLSQEWVSESFEAIPLEKDTAALQMIETLCRSAISYCKSEDFQKLLKELHEVSAAQDQLSAAMGPHPDDPELLQMWIALEREKSGILNQILNSI